MNTRTRAQAVESLQDDLAALVGIARSLHLANAADWGAEMPPAAFKVLTHVVRSAPVSPSALVEATGLARSVVSRQLSALAREGYVGSEPDPADGRVQLFSATAETAARLTAITRARQAQFRSSLAHWSDEELAEFARSFDRFVDALSGSNGQPGP